MAGLYHNFGKTFGVSFLHARNEGLITERKYGNVRHFLETMDMWKTSPDLMNLTSEQTKTLVSSKWFQDSLSASFRASIMLTFPLIIQTGFDNLQGGASQCRFIKIYDDSKGFESVRPYRDILSDMEGYPFIEWHKSDSSPLWQVLRCL